MSNLLFDSIRIHPKGNVKIKVRTPSQLGTLSTVELEGTIDLPEDAEWHALKPRLDALLARVYEYRQSETRPIEFRGVTLQHKPTSVTYSLIGYRTTQASPYGHNLVGFNRVAFNPDNYDVSTHLSKDETDAMDALTLWAASALRRLVSRQFDLFTNGATNGTKALVVEAVETP